MIGEIEMGEGSEMRERRGIHYFLSRCCPGTSDSLIAVISRAFQTRHRHGQRATQNFRGRCDWSLEVTGWPVTVEGQVEGRGLVEALHPQIIYKTVKSGVGLWALGIIYFSNFSAPCSTFKRSLIIQ
jgi:hypothetical protein